MKAFNFIFEVQTIFDVSALLNDYTYYSVEPDGRIVILKCREWLRDRKYGSYEGFISMLAVCLGVDERDLFFESENPDCKFINYTSLEFLKSIDIEGDIASFETPLQKYQLVAVRGTCSHTCSDTIPEYDGNALRQIPCCDKDKNLLETTEWSCKWMTIFDIMTDIFFWSRNCKGLDVLIYCFEIAQSEEVTDLPFEDSSFAAQIQGNVIRFITSAKERRKLFEVYSKKHKCIDC